MMRISEATKGAIEFITEKLILNQMRFEEDPKTFFESLRPDEALLSTINSQDFIRDEKNIIVKQLHRSRSIDIEIHNLASAIVNECDINCYPSEIVNYLHGFFCEYINTICMGAPNSQSVNDELIPRLLLKMTRKARRNLLSKRDFFFPCNAMGLTSSLELSPSVSVVLSDVDGLEALKDWEREAYLHDRHFMFDAYIKVGLKNMVSPKLGFDIAKRASVFTANLINMNAHINDLNIVPCALSDAKVKNTFEFYHEVSDSEGANKHSTRRFMYRKETCKVFWAHITKLVSDEHYRGDKILISEMMELCILNESSRRVIDLLISAINWYGDAFSESSEESRIVKCVTAIETIVNYRKGDKIRLGDKESDDDISAISKIFISRVCGIYQAAENSVVYEQADSIYEARSQIVHGARLTEQLTFCPLKFCRETIHAAIPLFYKFGLQRCDYKKSLGEYMDKLSVVSSPESSSHLAV